MTPRTQILQQLFNTPFAVSELIEEVFPTDLKARLRPDHLEAVPLSLDSRIVQRPSHGRLWRLPCGDLHLYLLVELADRVDPAMSLHMLTYKALAYQRLSRAGLDTLIDHMPLIMPVVLYTGEAPWSAPLQHRQRVRPEPSGLSRWQPRTSFLLVATQAQQREDVHRRPNLVALVSALNHCSTGEEFMRLARTARQHLMPLTAEGRRHFAHWLRQTAVERGLARCALPALSLFQEPGDDPDRIHVPAGELPHAAATAEEHHGNDGASAAPAPPA